MSNRESLPSINESIKMIALNLVDSMRLSDLKFGTVVSVDPLKIKIDDQEPLDENWLVLSNMVRDHHVDCTVSMQTENDAFMNPSHTHTGNMGSPTDSGNLDVTHKHEIKHKIKVLQHYGLTLNEKVILLRMQGGEKYYVMDRVNVPPTNGEWL